MERQRINSLFHSNPKNVYRRFRQNGKIEVEKTPPKEETRNFWENICSRRGTFNQENTWLNQVRKEYCKDVTINIRDIKYQHFVKINDNLKDSNSPGIDQVTGFWIIRSQCTREPTFNLLKKISYGEENIPGWLIKARTTLVAKNRETHNPKNYRPIACENIMLKTYTGTLAKLIEEYLMENNIIFPEQAGAKKGLWGCTDQLLINRIVTDEIKKGRKKNLCMLWLDYKKAYDSVPHAWILEALHLAKVLEKIILAIEHLIGK